MTKKEMNRNDRKSLKINMLLNALKSALNILFPLLTAPYIARVLHVENIGKFSFSSSFVEYFMLISNTAMAVYCIREGASIRDRKEIKEFVNEVFSLNIIITFIECAVLIGSVYMIPKLADYRELILILGILIPAGTLGVEWICSIYEDYFYITVRTIIIKIIFVISVFAFVKTQEDLYKYAGLYVFSNVFANIWNAIYSVKYCKVRLIFSRNMFRHVKNITYVTISTAAMVIYMSFDMLMLGFMTNDYYVGLYGNASKIYGLLKTVLSAFIIVAIPRFAYYIGNHMMEDFNQVLSELINTVVSVAIPIIIGVSLLSREIIIFLFGIEYEEAWMSLSILCLAAPAALLAYILLQCVMMAMKMEKEIMWITITSALVNVLLNFVMIPLYKQNGAAFTTVIAEILTLVLLYLFVRKKIQLQSLKSTLRKVMVGCISEIVICMTVKVMVDSVFFTILICMTTIPCYIIIEYFLKNEIIYSVINRFYIRIFVK